MNDAEDFDLKDFTPYMLAMATETASVGFQRFYKSQFGMLRTEWRVLFHLGRYGPMTAKEICDRARVHKTKVSRAVAALEAKRFLKREQQSQDRRLETLSLTKQGAVAFQALFDEARRFDARLTAPFSAEEREVLHRCLQKIAGI